MSINVCCGAIDTTIIGQIFNKSTANAICGRINASLMDCLICSPTLSLLRPDKQDEGEQRADHGDYRKGYAIQDCDGVAGLL